MQSLTSIKGLIIDMDGVLWHGSTPQSGLIDFFNCINRLRIPYILATNNASNTQKQYQQKLSNLDVNVNTNQILTSGMATAYFLSKRFIPNNTKVFVIGEIGATQPLEEFGFTILPTQANDNFLPADIVVCGKDESLTWDKLATATLHLHAGAEFFGTNGDTSLPTERGIIHGNGAILAALQAATNITPTIIGKPEAIIYQQAMNLLNTDPAHTVAIGDRLDTDILGAVRTGIKSILVLSGVSTEEDLNKLDYRPTWVMRDIREITQALQTQLPF